MQRIQIGCTLTPELFTFLQERASAAGLSLSAFVEAVLAKAVRRPPRRFPDPRRVVGLARGGKLTLTSHLDPEVAHRLERIVRDQPCGRSHVVRCLLVRALAPDELVELPPPHPGPAMVGNIRVFRQRRPAW